MARRFLVGSAAVAVASLLPVTGLASYEPTSFLDLVATSEFIGAGTITRVDAQTFELKIDELIVGTQKRGATIRVEKFRDWICARRWAAYEVGQKVFVFLNANDGRMSDAVWRIQGAACEGESLIVDGKVLANFHLPGLRTAFGEEVGRRSFVGVPMNKLKKAITDFRAIYRGTEGRIEEIGLLATSGPRLREALLKEFPTRSDLHQFLIKSVEEERTKSGQGVRKK